MWQQKKPLQYHWLLGQTTICKFIPQVCRAILVEIQDEHLHNITDPKKWEKVEEKFRTWNIPHTLGALDKYQISSIHVLNL